MDDLSIITEQDPKTDQVFLTCGHKCDQIPTTFCLQSLYPHFRFWKRPQIIYATICTLHLVLLLFFFVLNLSLAFDNFWQTAMAVCEWCWSHETGMPLHYFWLSALCHRTKMNRLIGFFGGWQICSTLTLMSLHWHCVCGLHDLPHYSS